MISFEHAVVLGIEVDEGRGGQDGRLSRIACVSAVAACIHAAELTAAVFIAVILETEHFDAWPGPAATVTTIATREAASLLLSVLRCVSSAFPSSTPLTATGTAPTPSAVIIYNNSQRGFLTVITTSVDIMTAVRILCVRGARARGCSTRGSGYSRGRRRCRWVCIQGREGLLVSMWAAHIAGENISPREQHARSTQLLAAAIAFVYEVTHLQLALSTIDAITERIATTVILVRIAAAVLVLPFAVNVPCVKVQLAEITG